VSGLAVVIYKEFIDQSVKFMHLYALHGRGVLYHGVPGSLQDLD